MPEFIKKIVMPAGQEIALVTPDDVEAVRKKGENDISSVRGDVSSVRSTVNTLQSTLNTVNSDVTTAKGDIATAKEEMRSANTAIAANRSELESQGAFLAELRRLLMPEKLREIGYDEVEIAECLDDVPDLTFADIVYAKEIYDGWDAETVSCLKKWTGDLKLRIFPKIDFGNVKNMGNAWWNCSNLAYIPHLDTSAVESGDYAFSLLPLRRINLTEWPRLKTANNLYWGLRQCISWPERLEFPELTSMQGLFGDNPELVADIPELVYDKEKITNYSYMFQNARLSRLPITDFGNTTNCGCAYAYFKGDLGDLSDVHLKFGSEAPVNIGGFFWMDGGRLTSLPALEGNIGNMELFSSGNKEIVSVPDYSNVAPTNLSGAFMECENLERVEGLDFSRIESVAAGTYFNPVFKKCGKLRYIRIVNLGQGPCKDLQLQGNSWGTGGEENRQSLVDSLLRDSYDRAGAGMAAAKITLERKSVELLGTEEIAAITAKGYTIAPIN